MRGWWGEFTYFIGVFTVATLIVAVLTYACGVGAEEGMAVRSLFLGLLIYLPGRINSLRNEIQKRGEE
jgi:hypothetical protein